MAYKTKSTESEKAMKQFFRILLGIILFVYLTASSASQSPVCAAQYGACSGDGTISCPTGNTRDQYGNLIDYCVDSVTLNFSVHVIGTPPSNPTITFEATAVDQTCSWVQCLKRADSTTVVWEEGAQDYNAVIDTLGCSDGNCNDIVRVSAAIEGCNNPEVADLDINGLNGHSRHIPFTIECPVPEETPEVTDIPEETCYPNDYYQCGGECPDENGELTYFPDNHTVYVEVNACFGGPDGEYTLYTCTDQGPIEGQCGNIPEETPTPTSPFTPIPTNAMCPVPSPVTNVQIICPFCD